MNLRKFLKCLALVGISLSLLVSGCSSSNEVAEKGQTSSESSLKYMNEKKPQITLSVMFSSHPWTKDLKEIPYFKQLEKKTNIKVRWEQVRSGWDEKKSAVLASGDLPDVFLTGLTDSDIVTNIENFYSLDELIKEYCPNITRMFSEEPDTKSISVFPDGKMYSLPQVRMYRPESYNVMMINQKWLDQVGMKMPSTLDELERVLVAFRDRDPNGNGKQDEIPLDWNKGRELFNISSLCGAFGVVDDMSGDMAVVKDGKVSFLFARDEFRRLYIYLNRLYKEKLINSEVFTQDYSQMEARSQDPSAVRVGVTLGWSIIDRVGPVYASQYEVMPPLKAEGTEKPLWPSNPARVKMGTDLFSMTRSNKYPERTMQWIDEFYGEDMSVQGYYGSIGECITKKADGTYIQLVPKSLDTSQDRWMWMNSLVDGSPMYISKDLEKKVKPTKEILTRLEQDKVYRPYFPAPRDIYPMVKFSKEAVDEMTLIKSDILKLVDQKMAQWVINGNVDSEWNSYMEQIHDMGLDRLTQLYQKAYDDYYSN